MKHKFSAKYFLFIWLLLAFVVGANAQENARKTTVVIKSTVECELCKKNVEKHLSKVKGIRKVTADFKTHQITIVFNSKRISLEEIKKRISDIGYDADDVPANNRMNQLLKHRQQQSNPN